MSEDGICGDRLHPGEAGAFGHTCSENPGHAGPHRCGGDAAWGGRCGVMWSDLGDDDGTSETA